MKKTKRTISHEEFMKEYLKDPKDVEAYLNAALEDDDPRVFLLALKDVAKASGGMSKVAKEANLNRESLYRTLKKGNPKFESMNALIRALGFKIALEVCETKRKPSTKKSRKIKTA